MKRLESVGGFPICKLYSVHKSPGARVMGCLVKEALPVFDQINTLQSSIFFTAVRSLHA